MLLSYTTQNILLVKKEQINTNDKNKFKLNNSNGNFNKDPKETERYSCVLSLGKLFAPKCLPSKSKEEMSRSKFWVRKENCRLWGEEKEEDAVWGVYLKKVRYQRPSAIVQIVQASGNHNLSVNSNSSGGRRSISSNEDSQEIAHLMWETVKVKVLKAGSLEKVVEAIANDDSDVQATHLSVFLATYRAFASPPQVVHEIIKIYKRAKSETLRKAMLDSLHVWLDTFPEDFEPGSEGFNCLQKTVLPFTHEENLKSLSLKVQYKLRTRRKMRKSASVHSLKTQLPLQIKTYSVILIPESHFAQQLTFIDKEMFLNLRVWECLGGIWKSRSRQGCPTVAATVEQFNALSGRVVATILLDPTATIQQRAKYLDKWIRVAQELRQLKNFSSLKAIISGLECNSVWRLSKIWSLISKDRISIFSQLSQIFSEDNNRMAQRTLLEAEGTAKFPTPTKNPKDKRFFSRVLRGHGSTSRLTSAEFDSPNGTIPYLGTFLTDLTFIDSAISDKAHGDLINFEKRRKEFEILAQLKLLQGSAKGYRLEEDPYFSTWFNSLVVLDDKAAYELSLGIQPEKNAPLKGHRKTDSFTSHSSSENLESGLQRKGSIPSSNESSLLYGTANGSTGNGSGILSSPTPETSIVVKVFSPVKGDVMYKSMMIGNSDHTPQVIGLALEKLGLEDQDPKNFTLVQILPHKELKFPPSSNIFYAVDTSVKSSGGDIRLEIRPSKLLINNNNNSLRNPYGKSPTNQQPRST